MSINEIKNEYLTTVKFKYETHKDYTPKDNDITFVK